MTKGDLIKKLENWNDDKEVEFVLSDPMIDINNTWMIAEVLQTNNNKHIKIRIGEIIVDNDETGVFETVGDLIKYLESLGSNRLLIYDTDGNTGKISKEDICLWDQRMGDSPVALYIDPERF